MKIINRINQIKTDMKYDFCRMRMKLNLDDYLRIYRDNKCEYLCTLNKLDEIPKDLLYLDITNENIIRVDKNDFNIGTPYAICLYSNKLITHEDIGIPMKINLR